MTRTSTNLVRALGSGLIGACTLTLLHESARRVVPHAPRMDVLGMRSIAKTMRALGRTPPRGRRLHRAAMAGDLLSNALYYSLVGGAAGSRSWMRGSLLGAGAGLGAALLPPRIGLGRQPGERAPATHAMTFAWYLVGGLAAAGAARLMKGR